MRGKRDEWVTRQQTEGIANANIFVFNGCIGGAFSTRIDKDGDKSTETIFALRSSIPGGVGGDADEAGEVEAEFDGEGVGGVMGGVSYDDVVTLLSGAGACTGFGGKDCRWPNEGMGLVLEFGGGTGADAEDDGEAMFAFFNTIWSEYVGYGPGPRKSRLTIISKFDSMGLSTVSSHSR
jgi:hypothetical protein